MLILNQKDVCEALPMQAAIAAMRWAYQAWSQGLALMPPRNHLEIPGKAAVSLFMPAFVPGSPDGAFPAALVVKAVSVVPSNAALGLNTIQGAVLVLSPDSGECLACLDGSALTAIRTGAGAGIATEVLARPESSTLALLGAGGQAMTQLQAVCAVREVETVWIYSRTLSRARDLREKMAGQGTIPTDIRIVLTAREALLEADIVCTATTATQALFEDRDLKSGVHINAVGAFRREMQEIPSAVVKRSRLFVDNRAAALAEAGDLIQPIEAGWIDASHITGEIGEVLAGTVPGRRDQSELTLFKSVGMAVQDAVAAMIAYTRAQEQGLGQRVRWTDIL